MILYNAGCDIAIIIVPAVFRKKAGELIRGIHSTLFISMWFFLKQKKESKRKILIRAGWPTFQEENDPPPGQHEKYYKIQNNAKTFKIWIPNSKFKLLNFKISSSSLNGNKPENYREASKKLQLSAKKLQSTTCNMQKRRKTDQRKLTD